MARIVLRIIIGETDTNRSSFRLHTKNLSSTMFSLEGEVDGRASPTGTILREPIETQICSSRYAPAYHGALQGKGVVGSGYFQPRYLP
ncbi:hypothetical protein AVEN_7560-1 [Araneus ventricosus]|uniref:Uncharacterized protein n=1 Tax=Araneus ventricosus TaxID=182803 RepID=A0A4Y2TGP3_ARAVE|nr:hypothetical protein AVEN_7560-1 [Araneus ventricosus]